MTEQDSEVGWMWVLSKAEVSRLIWTGLRMGGGVIVSNGGLWMRRRFEEGDKKPETPRWRG